MSLRADGRVRLVRDARQVTERFRVREIVVTLEPDSEYPQPVTFQATGVRCELLDAIEVGQDVHLVYSLRGREWRPPDGEPQFFNSLELWAIKPAEGER